MDFLKRLATTALGKHRLHIATTLLGIFFSILLFACSSDTSTNSITVTGIVGDDPIIGAHVTVLSIPEEENEINPGEGVVLGTAVTDSTGRYTLAVIPQPPYRLSIAGGTMNGTPFLGVFTAYCATADQCNASPYTSSLDKLMLYEGKNEAEAAHELAHIINESYDPFLYELQTGQAVPASHFDLAAARSALTTQDAISQWIWDLTDYTSKYPGAVAPAGVQVPLTTIPSGQNLRKGPYLLLTGKNTEMKIMLQGLFQNPPSEVEISWASVSGDSGSFTPPPATADQDYVYQHTITGLNAGTFYDYKIRYRAVSSAVLKTYSSSGRFKTPPADGATNVSFYAYGDTRSNPHTHNNIESGMLTDMKLSEEDRQTFALHVGDFVLRGNTEYKWDDEFFSRDTDYESTRKFLSSFPLAAAVGNHEFRGDTAVPKVDDNKCGKSNNGDIFRKYWPSDLYHIEEGTTKTNYYYSFDYGPVHFTVIDPYTSKYDETSAQYKWLDSDLKATKKKWKVVVTHVPFYDASGSNADAGCGENGAGKSMRDALKPLIDKHKVQLVLQGHQHYFSRSVIDNTTYYVIGGGGAAPLMTPRIYPFPAPVPYSNSGKIYQFARIDVSTKEMKVTIKEVKNAGSVDKPLSNISYDTLTIYPDGSTNIVPPPYPIL